MAEIAAPVVKGQQEMTSSENQDWGHTVAKQYRKSITVEILIESGVHMEIFEKCWEIKECGKKHKCPVYPHYGRSCWLIRGKLRSIYGESEMACEAECQSCEVYQWHMTLLQTISRGVAKQTA
jgi:hypothetical protein